MILNYIILSILSFIKFLIFYPLDGYKNIFIIIIFMEFQEKEQKFAQNNANNTTALGRICLFTHLLTPTLEINQKLSANQHQLQISDVPNISNQESIQFLSQKFQSQVQEYQKKSPLTPYGLFCVFFKIFKADILLIELFALFEGIFKIISAMMVQFAMQSVSIRNFKFAYIYVTLLLTSLLISSVSMHNGHYFNYNLCNRIKALIMYQIYKKVSGLSRFMIKVTNMGKIINMLSSDLNPIQSKLSIFFCALIYPIVYILIGICLIFNLGWYALLCIITPLLFFPIQILLGKANAGHLTQLNIFKDKRLKIINDVIEGIRFIKLYSWELTFNKIIGILRQTEIKKYISISLNQSIYRAFINSTPLWGILLTFIAVAYTSDNLTTSKIFSTIRLILYLKYFTFYAIFGINFVFDLQIIFTRFNDIYNLDNIRLRKILEQNKMQVSKIKSNGQNNKIIQQKKNNNIRKGEIIFEDFDGFWSVDDFTTPSLKNINMTFRQGKFYGITGKVGSGKSGLLSVILKEIPYYSGNISIEGQVAYVEQQPYIFAGSIRQNITFGKMYDQVFYNEVVKACCLESDFKIFPNGDHTLVGERGITVSGGQKARLSVARAVYSRSDIYLLDDPISAVDAKVGRRIYEDVIKGMLKEKTVLLVTHQVNYLTQCDNILIMEDGGIKYKGTPNELQIQLRKLMVSQSKQVHNKIYQTSNNSLIADQLRKQSHDQIQSVMINQKEQSVSQVTFKTFLKYMFYNQVKILIPFMLLFFVGSQGINTIVLRLLSNYQDRKANGNTIQFRNYWIILGLLQLQFLVLLIVKYFILNYIVLQSNKQMHKDMFYKLIRSPSLYFDKTPSGRLINRFSNDVDVMDTTLIFTIIEVIQIPITYVIFFVNIFQILPYYIPFGLVKIGLLLYWYYYCKNGIIQTKMLDLKSKTPIFQNMQLTLSGINQITTYNQNQHFNKKMMRCINNSIKANNSYYMTSRIFGCYSAYISYLFSGIGIFIGVQFVNQPGLFGMLIGFLVQFSDMIQWCLRQFITLQSTLLSVIRVQNIIDLPSEAPLTTDYDERLKNSTQLFEANWSDEASIEFRNYYMRYRPQLDPVLNNLNFTINAGEKIGIVGRTGAGKSSIIHALFRMTEGEQGSEIIIGGCNTRLMGLHSLRNNLSIIPQIPFLFKGSIRQNLDPFNQKSDEALYKALEESDLKTYVESLTNKLDTEISNASEILSVGQKQLMCLARAILRNNKILVLDEATSNVDMRTDDFIQKTLKTKFKGQTIITIAHRLNTIADYDRVIVIDKGRVIQIGTPFQLLAKDIKDKWINKEGMFAQMVKSTGQNAQIIFSIARNKHLNSQK